MNSSSLYVSFSIFILCKGCPSRQYYEINKNSRNHVVMESFKRLVTCQLQYKARIKQRTVPVGYKLTTQNIFWRKLENFLQQLSKTRLQDSNIFISLGTKAQFRRRASAVPN